MTMLTVAEARAKARTRLKSSLAAWATGVVFTEPITTDPGETEPGPTSAAVEIALHPPTEKQVLADQEAAADWPPVGAPSRRLPSDTALQPQLTGKRSTAQPSIGPNVRGRESGSSRFRCA